MPNTMAPGLCDGVVIDAQAPLLRRARNGDKNARSVVVEQNSGLIWSIVRRYFGRGARRGESERKI